MATTGVLGSFDAWLSNFVLGVAATSPPPPPPPPPATDPQIHLGPQHPLRTAGAIPIVVLGTIPGIMPFSLSLFVQGDSVLPPGQQNQADNNRQTQVPPFPATSIIVGPWSPAPFVPVRQGYFDHQQAPPIQPSQVEVMPPNIMSITPGPWNNFGRFRDRLATQGGNAPVPPPVGPPPPPPPPQSGVFGPPRRLVVQVPTIARNVDDRLRPHVDIVADILNSLLRAGYIKKVGDEYVLGGAGISFPRPPSVTDDVTVGAIVGGTYIDTLNNDLYVCFNNSVGSAVWRKVIVV